ncbi:hypothetical protein A2U01_0060069, partial [Trifolium medium]|nr:hypothetical protein [Trifolium medium]
KLQQRYKHVIVWTKDRSLEEIEENGKIWDLEQIGRSGGSGSSKAAFLPMSSSPSEIQSSPSKVSSSAATALWFSICSGSPFALVRLWKKSFEQ